MGASLRPDQMVEGGGLLDDVDAIVKSSKFITTDYSGKLVNKVPVAEWILDTDGEEVVQLWSVGTGVKPSKDGRTLEGGAVSKSSNLFMLMSSLVESGFPIEKIGDDFSIFEGLGAHFVRVPAPDRPGLKKRKREDGREYDPTVLVVNAIHKLPWENEKTAPGGNKKQSTVDVTPQATAVLLALLAEHNTLPKAEVIGKGFTYITKDVALKDNVNALIALLSSDDFLRTQAGWTYKDGIITQIDPKKY